ncbi:alpha-galactosidase [Dubosiella newyorkensis]|uniref:alpha-galactosidase n=1 Tax=Dubosiella newyorkensis TaxID=1862672 RepID=UPI0032B1E36F
MPIIYHSSSRTFHLYNARMSYILKVLKNGHIAQLYCGKKIHDREDFDALLELEPKPMSVCAYKEDPAFSLEHIKREFPSALSGDMRMPSIDVRQENGSRILNFVYQDHAIFSGKPALEGLPATYVEREEEASTLHIHLYDEVCHLKAILQYSIFEERNVLSRSVRLENEGEQTLVLERLASLNLDLPDSDYDFVDLKGAWARERHIQVQPLHPGIQSIYSIRGHSSNNFNPFLGLKRKNATEAAGEMLGFTLVYSGNFLAQVDVDVYDTARISIGMHPFTFSWPLLPSNHFQSPEALFVYSDQGMNGMSQTFHKLFRERLCRGPWKSKARPILMNNWEGTYFDFDEDKILKMAKEAKALGVELFVLDDGWFEGRNSDTSSLGDWWPDRTKLPEGIDGLGKKIESMGLRFGLWIEPEMVNEKSELYEKHPDWVLGAPERSMSQGRHQYVLDFSNLEVVDYIFGLLVKVLDEAPISYVKWDMNRSMSEVYSLASCSEEQGTIYHRYILGVYRLYSMLIERYPHILFESCASGGARFDPGMLYYAPQTWTSDDTDAAERIKIQYGTSVLYPLCSMGSHVSAIPNHQLNRNTPLQTRAEVAYFGTFGYELDPLKLDEEEKKAIKKQIEFMKKYRELIQFGTFYRLVSPFEKNECAWMVVSDDRNMAIVAYYRILQEVNSKYRRLYLQGLDPNKVYRIEGKDRLYYGDELMYAGLVNTDASCGEQNLKAQEGDFLSRLYILHGKDL